MSITQLSYSRPSSTYIHHGPPPNSTEEEVNKHFFNQLKSKATRYVNALENLRDSLKDKKYVSLLSPGTFASSVILKIDQGINQMFTGGKDPIKFVENAIPLLDPIEGDIGYEINEFIIGLLDLKEKVDKSSNNAQKLAEWVHNEFALPAGNIELRLQLEEKYSSLKKTF